MEDIDSSAGSAMRREWADNREATLKDLAYQAQSIGVRRRHWKPDETEDEP